jgi:peptidoglycan/xylan/chitin deacetylase (PgdA/CDA1 family)
MNFKIPIKRMLIKCAGILLITIVSTHQRALGQTEITKWQYGKRGAVSITYDDGSINQFCKALPIMNRLKIPATFFINTGQISGSQFHGKFVGRPIDAIIENTAILPTSEENFYERSSAAGFLGYKGCLTYHARAGAKIDAGKPEEAYKIIDDLYKKVRNGELPLEDNTNNEINGDMGVTWDEIRSYAAQGHEFASHMVTHPRLAALDEVNMLYELEKSREEIRIQLGQKYTFSAECPYGTENERVMEIAYKIYPALRNRMPEHFLEELNRSNRKNPGSINKEYVQWQRGATTKTPLPLMKSWIDTTTANDNIWLVLVFHGIDGIGWEALTSESLNEYFQYLKSHDSNLWIATFADVTKYMRERMNSTVKTVEYEGKTIINLKHSLDVTMYNIPLTLKTYIISEWKEVLVKQAGYKTHIHSERDVRGTYILYQAYPNNGAIELSGIEALPRIQQE